MKQYIHFKCWVKETTLLRYYRRAKRLNNIKKKTNAEYFAKKIAPYANDEEMSSLVSDIWMMAKNYEFFGDEYLYYHFQNKTLEERLEFVNDLEHVDVTECINKPRNLYIFEDKAETYKRYKDFYKRDVIALYSRVYWGGRRLLEFAEKHGRIIIKPLASSCGQGVMIIDHNKVDNKEDYYNRVVRDYCKGLEGGLIAEEVLSQVSELEQFHPTSLNTVRITTIRFNDHVEIIGPFIRFGRGGLVVDNGGAGGIICDIDAETGKIIACADETGTPFTKHPDTGLDLIGFTIPQWEEAKTLARQLAQVIPSNRYTGWDLALTPEKGWVMIEGNARGQFVGWQIPLQKGFRAQANDILKRLGKPLLKNYKKGGNK